MKKYVMLLVTALSLSLAAIAAQGQQLIVEGMTCSSCADSIKKAFLENPAVQDVSVEVKSGKVLLTFKPEKTLSEAEIRKIVETEGYKVKKVSPPSNANAKAKS